jgi:transposase-like protein
MTHTDNHIEDVLGSQEAFQQIVKERLRQAVRIALISVLEEEVTAFIGAEPYERNEQRRDQRNGVIWTQRSDTWQMCQFRVRVVGTRRRSLSATIAVKTS